MTKDKRPWLKFFPRDWLGDAELRGCSLAAQGLWMQMMCLMHECDRRGVLETVGIAWGDEQIVSAIAGNSDVVRSCLDEVLSRGVASRCGAGKPEDGDCPCLRFPCPRTDAVISRRMVRDDALSTMRIEVGSLGGRASLLKQKSKQKPTKALTSDICNLNPKSSSKKDVGNPRAWMSADVLKTEAFDKVWSDWVSHRSEIGKSLKPTTVSRQLRQLEKWGHNRAIEAIDTSIRNGWTGLFEPDAKPGSWTHEDDKGDD